MGTIENFYKTYQIQIFSYAALSILIFLLIVIGILYLNNKKLTFANDELNNSLLSSNTDNNKYEEIKNIKEEAEKLGREDKVLIGDFLSAYYLDWLKIEDHIINVNQNLTENDVENQKHLSKIAKEIADLLGRANLIVAMATGQDVSCNIKVWHTKDYLTTKWRVRSDEEQKRKDANKIEHRKVDEYFRVLPGESVANIRHKGKKIKVREKNKQQSGEKYTKIRYNSAYNTIYDSKEPYWLGNNLPKLVDDSKYFSSSDNYELYYTSLAIFKMEDPTMEQDMLKSSGLLIFDINGASFDKDMIKPYGLFLARSMHALLVELHDLNEKVAKLKGKI